MACSGDITGYCVPLDAELQVRINNLGAPGRHDWEWALEDGHETVARRWHFASAEAAFEHTSSWLAMGRPAALALRPIENGQLNWYAVDGPDFDVKIVEDAGVWRYQVGTLCSGPCDTAQTALITFTLNFNVCVGAFPVLASGPA